jgi:hypothetical protein
MNKGNKKVSRNVTSDGYAYLTKRTLARKAQAAVTKAAGAAMNTMGYVVVQEGDWVVKKHADGRQERLVRI